MAFAASFFVIFCIKERLSNSKHLQFVSGVKVWVFWGTAFVCDLVVYLILMIGILISFAALQEDGFKSSEDLGESLLIFSTE